MRSLLRPFFVLWVFVGASVLLARPATGQEQEGALRGFTSNAETGRPLAGVNVRLELLDEPDEPPRGTSSNGEGYYQIGGLAPGRYALRASFVGYRAYRDTLRLRGGVVSRNIELRPGALELEGVTVSTDEPGAADLEAGLQTIEPEGMGRVPTPSATGDLATYLKTLPGVTSLGDRGGGLYVRGGSPTQNLVLMDGILVYRPFHILGFFSAFPQNLVRRADFYAGGFPARYSGRLSSVMDVKMRGGSNEGFGGAAGASPLAASVQVEGPIWYGASSFMLSARRSLIEPVAPTLLGQEQSLYFEEQFAKYERVFSSGRCSLTGLHTYDRGKVDPERRVSFKWSNYAAGGRCVWAPASSATLVEIKAGVSGMENSVGSDVQAERSASVWRFRNGVNLTIPQGEGRNLRVGFQVAGVTWPSTTLRERFQGIRTESDFFLTNRIYGGYEWSLLDGRVTVKPSMGLGGTLDKLNLEPRLRASWRPWSSEGQELNAALTLHHQLLQGVTDERDAGSVFTARLPEPIDRSRSQALHAVLGWSQQVGHFDVTAEGFYKRLRALPVPVWSTRARFTTELDQARGNVYGFDTRLEYEQGPLYGYVGYQWSRTRYELEDRLFGEAFGNPVQEYSPPHARRHNLNVVAQAELPWATASLRWQYGSGRPYTRPIGFDDFFDLRRNPDVRAPGESRFLFEKPYRGRLPAYHRLDVSLERAFTLGAAELTAKAGAINSYNRRNLFYFDLFTFERVDQLPLVPFFSLKASLR
jgi:hypothetical protein